MYDVEIIFETLESMEGWTGLAERYDTLEKFWKKCLDMEDKASSTDIDVNVSLETVRQIAYRKWEAISYFKDSVLSVLEVPETFPTIFFM